MSPLKSLLVALFLLSMSGCTAMMVGGGASYEPPADECEDDDQNCRSR